MKIGSENTAPTFPVLGEEARLLKVLLSPKLQGDMPIASGLTVMEPGQKTDCIGHEEGEMFYVISGTGKMVMGEEEADLEPTVCIWAPPHTRHQMLNTGSKDLKVLWVLCPPGREEAIIENSI